MMSVQNTMMDSVDVVNNRSSSKFPELTTAIVKKRIGRGKLPSSGVYWITIAMAKELLGINTDKNRKPYDPDSMVRSLLRNEWDLTTDNIGINSETEMINGQNRLRSLVRADEIAKSKGSPNTIKGLDCGVMFNLPPKSIESMDEGKKRKPHEAAQILGIPMTSSEGKTARRILAGIDHRHAFGNHEIIEYYKEKRGQIMSTCELCSGRGNEFNAANSEELRSVLTRARIKRHPVEYIERFVEILKSGSTNGTAEEYAVIDYGRCYRRWELAGGDNRKWLYALTDLAVMCYLTDELPSPKKLVSRKSSHYPLKLYKSATNTVPAAGILDFFKGDLSPLVDYTERFPVHAHEKK